MKINELMIGDWVWSGYSAQIEGMDKRYDVIRLLGNIQWYKTDEHLPIPLTPEILEMNGFKATDWANSLLFSKCFENDDLICPFYIEYRLDSQCLLVNEGLVPTPVKYVHQLQHALRLCGLNDEADNIKVEGAQS